MYALPERTMNVFQVIKHAFIFWTKTFYLVLPLALAYGLLKANAINLLMIGSTQTPHPLFSAGMVFLNGLMIIVLYVAMFVKLNGELTGKMIGLWGALKTGITRFLSALYLSFLVTFLIGVPVILILVTGHFSPPPINPVIYLLIPLFLAITFVYLFVSFPLVAAEDVVATSAIKQSYHLVKQQWWHTFFVLITMFCIMTIPEAIAYKSQLMNNPFVIVILSTLITPLFCVVSLIQLRHLRAYHKLHDSAAA